MGNEIINNLMERKERRREGGLSPPTIPDGRSGKNKQAMA